MSNAKFVHFLLSQSWLLRKRTIGGQFWSRVRFRGRVGGMPLQLPHALASLSSCTIVQSANSSKMPSDDDSSDLSSLSSLSPVPSDIELEQGSDSEEQASKKGILKFFSKVSDQEPRSPSPPPRKRSPSPTHEYVLADNPDIAVCLIEPPGACATPG